MAGTGVLRWWGGYICRPPCKPLFPESQPVAADMGQVEDAAGVGDDGALPLPLQEDDNETDDGGGDAAVSGGGEAADDVDSEEGGSITPDDVVQLEHAVAVKEVLLRGLSARLGAARATKALAKPGEESLAAAYVRPGEAIEGVTTGGGALPAMDRDAATANDALAAAV